MRAFLISAVLIFSAAAAGTERVYGASYPVHACGPLDYITFVWRVDQRYQTYSKVDGYLSGIGAVAGLRFRGTITIPPASHIQELDLWFDSLGPSSKRTYTEAVLYSKNNRLVWLAFMDNAFVSRSMVKIPCKR